MPIYRSTDLRESGELTLLRQKLGYQEYLLRFYQPTILLLA